MNPCEVESNTRGEEIIDDNCDEEHIGLKEKLKHPDYRIKLISTLQVASAFGVTGWITGLKGPCLLDFLLITNSPLEKGSGYFTSASVGYAVGSLFGGIALDRYNRNLIFFASLLVCGVSITVTPWCFAYWAMLSCHFILGITNGVIDTGCNAECIRIWGKQAGPYLQFIVFVFAFGSILSPLAAKPYLATTLERNTQLIVPEHGYHMNESAFFSNASRSNYKHTGAHQSQSRIYIILSLTGALSTIVAVSFLVKYCRDSGQANAHALHADNFNKTVVTLSVCEKQTALILLGLLLLFYCAIEETSGSFLVAFVSMRFGWTKVKGSDLTSVLFACIAVGRFSGIFVSHFCQSCKLVIVSLICVLACYIALFFGTVNGNEIVIWLFTGLSGISMSYVYSAVFSWSEEDMVTVTAKISAYFVLMSSAGSSISPVTTGFLMQENGPMSFIYVSMASTVMSIIMCTILLLFVKFKIQRTGNSNITLIVDEPKVAMLDN